MEIIREKMSLNDISIFCILYYILICINVSISMLDSDRSTSSNQSRFLKSMADDVTDEVT